MAVKTFNTRIKLKYDSSANWGKESELTGLTLLPGEFGYDYTKKNFFIGDGNTSSKNLKYVIGESIMADYDAAPTDVTLTDPIANTDSLNVALAKLQRQVTVATGVASIDNQAGEFTTGNGISSTSNVLDVITTGYLTVGNSGVDINSTKIASNYTTTDTTNLATVATVTSALGTLTDTLTGTPGASNTITAFDEVDGKVSATFGAISITSSQISDLASHAVTSVKGDGTYLEPATAAVGDVTISHKTITQGTTTSTGTVGSGNTGTTGTFTVPTVTVDGAGHVTSTDTKTITVTFPSAADLGLTSAMHFIGVSSTEITDGGTEQPTIDSAAVTPAAGDVVLYGSKEFVWTGSAWELLGDEGSYALKNTGITASGALTSTAKLDGTGSITHNTSGVNAGTYATNSSTTLTNGGTFNIPQVTVDTYGHVTAASDVTLTLPTITANNATLSITDGTTTDQIFSADASTDATVTFTGSTGITATVSDNQVTIGHSNSITAGTASGSATGTVAYGGTIDIPTVTYDAQGHITGKGTTTVTLPAAQTATEVTYTNTTSGLTASTVQAAIDEVAGTVAGAVQDVKSIDTTATTAQTPASETVEGTGTITLHKISKTANTDDLIQGMTLLFDCGSATTVTDTVA